MILRLLTEVKLSDRLLTLVKDWLKHLKESLNK